MSNFRGTWIRPTDDILKLTQRGQSGGGGQNRYGADADWDVLDGVHIGATWWIRLNHPWAATMRPYDKLLWSLVWNDVMVVRTKQSVLFFNGCVQKCKYIVNTCMCYYLSLLNIIFCGCYRHGCIWNSRSCASGNILHEQMIADHAWHALLLLMKCVVVAAILNIFVISRIWNEVDILHKN